MHEASLTHLSVSASAEQASGKMLLHAQAMTHLAPILPKLENVDMSGQCELGYDGWNAFCQEIEKAIDMGTCRFVFPHNHFGAFA